MQNKNQFISVPHRTRWKHAQKSQQIDPLSFVLTVSRTGVSRGRFTDARRTIASRVSCVDKEARRCGVTRRYPKRRKQLEDQLGLSLR
ncbi:hypothetical protein BIFBIF_00095 [Bifidobacterium bifidum ATCC 29521 = JCM 1255 = DSM 20456]|nr:hypothetical protein BIFBIF_00095 [Bifidobacterium bifidum ATCC 29521 = JCM 1255 = DSM 20456]